MADHHYIEVALVAPEGVVLKGKFMALSAINDGGQFDILPQHANLISKIKEKIWLRVDRTHVQEITLNHGILMCRNNKVDVFVGLVT